MVYKDANAVEFGVQKHQNAYDIDSASLTASVLNSPVYSHLGTLISRISTPHTADVSNFLLYVKSRISLFTLSDTDACPSAFS
jgi:hypothetical protein